MRLGQMYVSKKENAITTLNVVNDDVYIINVNWLISHVIDNVVLDKLEAIEIAMCILKDTNIIPQKTTIEELEKQGKI